ncbi:hypothetical protein [Azoarcus sp. KH32C]|uniref:hypothetical protein n=1 Tax=Azoarcus sp. KH32C TaxID=748247 RepID=UPI0002386A03|nr:hypothetical protein [Azoarcus sp. KH32C]BAL23241.1 hypothetical protein AZKH_0905 [Azoarcus sp. KH32C]
MMISRYSLLGLVWGFLGVLVIVAFPADAWQATVGVLMLGQAYCGVIVLHRFRLTEKAVMPDFLTLMLLMQLFSKTLTALGLVVSGNAAEAGMIGAVLAVREIVPFEYQFQAELVFLLAAIVFTLIWRRLEGKHPVSIMVEPAPRTMFMIYAVSLGTYLLLSAAGLLAALGMTAELLRLFSIGAIAVLLGGRTKYALGKPKSWLALLALFPLYVMALQTGMKGEAALVSLPILLPIFRRMTLNRAMLLLGCAVVIVVFLFPFTQEWRKANWEHAGGSATQKTDIAEVASRVIARWERDGFTETAAESAANWLTRGASAEQGGLVMQIAERDGLIGPVLIEGLASIFIPRFLWPGKPQYMPGAWFTWYLGKADSPESATTSTAMMLPTELYWMFGIPGVLIGMGLLGWLYFATSRYLIQRATLHLIPLVGYFAFLARASGLQEIHTIYAASSPIVLLVYVMIFDRLQRAFFPGRLRKISKFKSLNEMIRRD